MLINYLSCLLRWNQLGPKSCTSTPRQKTHPRETPQKMHVPRCLRRWRVLVTQTHGEKIGLRRKFSSVLQLFLKVNFLSFLFSFCIFNASLLRYVFSVFQRVSWHEPLSAPFHRDYFLHFDVALNKTLPPDSVSNHLPKRPSARLKPWPSLS